MLVTCSRLPLIVMISLKKIESTYNDYENGFINYESEKKYYDPFSPQLIQICLQQMSEGFFQSYNNLKSYE